MSEHQYTEIFLQHEKYGVMINSVCTAQFAFQIFIISILLNGIPFLFTYDIFLSPLMQFKFVIRCEA